jgi:hypothetical protein
MSDVNNTSKFLKNHTAFSSLFVLWNAGYRHGFLCMLRVATITHPSIILWGSFDHPSTSLYSPDLHLLAVLSCFLGLQPRHGL